MKKLLFLAAIAVIVVTSTAQSVDAKEGRKTGPITVVTQSCGEKVTKKEIRTVEFQEVDPSGNPVLDSKDKPKTKTMDVEVEVTVEMGCSQSDATSAVSTATFGETLRYCGGQTRVNAVGSVNFMSMTLTQYWVQGMFGGIVRWYPPSLVPGSSVLWGVADKGTDGPYVWETSMWGEYLYGQSSGWVRFKALKYLPLERTLGGTIKFGPYGCSYKGWG